MPSGQYAVFVYGTLRPALKHPMGAWLQRYADSLGPATVPGRLLDLGPYPGAVPVARGEAVLHGEVLRLRREQAETVLGRLDAYEGFDPARPERSLYRRAAQRVKLVGGEEQEAWVYWYNGPVTGHQVIAGGDYVAYVQARGATGAAP